MSHVVTKDMQKCRGCKSRFSHGLTIADDPPVWMWHYCSEDCEKWYVKKMLVRLLEEMGSYLDSDGITKKDIREHVAFCRKELGI